MKKMKKYVACALALMLAISAVQPMGAVAAKKPKISATKLTIAIGKSTKSWKVYDSKANKIKEAGRIKLTVNNKVKGAKYIFEPKNDKSKEIASINSKGVITGLKEGKAIFVCKQVLKHTKKIIGKCTITVKAPTVIPNTTLDVGDELEAEDFLTYCISSKGYTVKVLEGSDIFDADDEGELVAVEVGKAKVQVLDAKGTTIGTSNIAVVDVEEIDEDAGDDDEDEDEDEDDSDDEDDDEDDVDEALDDTEDEVEE